MLNLVKIREKSQILLGILLFFFILSMTAGGLVGGANIMDIILDTGDSGGRFVGKVGKVWKVGKVRKVWKIWKVWKNGKVGKVWKI